MSIEDSGCSGVWVSSNGAFPEPDHPPAEKLGGRGGLSIALLIALHLVFPEVCVRPGERLLPAMSRAGVPVVAVNENGEPVAWQDKVGSTPGCEAAVQSEPGAFSVQGLAEQ